MAMGVVGVASSGGVEACGEGAVGGGASVGITGIKTAGGGATSAC